MPGGPTPSRFRASRWLWAAGTVLLVAATGLATWRFTRTAGPPGPDAAAEAPPRLTAGHDYYFHVKLVELTERRPNGKKWDAVDGSGPDIQFSLNWRGNGIWKSAEKPDTLIGSWDLLKVDVRQVLTSSGKTDLDELVNAPLVQYAPGETVELKVWDSDTVGSDDAGTIAIKLDELRPGENTLVPTLNDTNAVKRVVLTLVDRRTTLPDLVNTISNR